MTLKERIDEAREAGCSAITIEGTVYTIAYNIPTVQAAVNQELTAEQIVAPLSVFDELSDDDVLYYATPYWDQLQLEKVEQAKKRSEQPE